MAQVELVFFTVAKLGICFGFVLDTVLVIQGYFSLLMSSAYRESRPFLLLTPPASNLDVHRRWEVKQLGQLTYKRISHSIWHHTQHIKLEEKERRGGGTHLE